MEIDAQTLNIYRIISIENLEDCLSDGLYCKHSVAGGENYKSIGSKDVIERRSTTKVKAFPDTVVNDYVPFYFSVRTPMLYNIITGRGVPAIRQENIIYLCFKLVDLANDKFQWCYTNGNAATAITKFFKKLDNIENKIDWHSIYTTDFRDENADGDEDRKRKKHAEFLVKDHVPASLIKAVVVLNEKMKTKVETVVKKAGINIPVYVNPKNKFYFL